MIICLLWRLPPLHLPHGTLGGRPRHSQQCPSSGSPVYMREKSIAVIVVAAGKGERVGVDGTADPKQYRSVSGVPVLARTLYAFLDLPFIAAVLPVIHPDHGDLYAALNLTDDR